MAHEIINVGLLPNDGAGDSLRTAFNKINNNFSSLFDVNPTLTFEPIRTGSSVNDGTGDTLVVAFEKLINNFNKLYAVAPTAPVVQFTIKDPWRTTFEKVNASFNSLFEVIPVAEKPVIEVITPVEVNDASYTGNISITNNFNIYLTNTVEETSNVPKLTGTSPETLVVPIGPFGSQEWINVGAQPNDGTGDPLRVAFEKINNNFSNLYYTTTSTYEAYSVGLTQGQVLLEIPVTQFTQGKFQIQSSDDMGFAAQDITLSAQLARGGVKFTGYGTTFSDTTGICNYDMDVVDGNVRVLTNPIEDTTIFHFIAAQVTYYTSTSEIIDIGLNGYPFGEVMGTETGDPNSTGTTMRANEFIIEGKTKLEPNQADALPATYVIPELPNQDPYLQYRFGVAIAGAKGRQQREKDGVSSASRESVFGENEIVVSYGHDAGEYIDDALKQMGMSGKKMVSTPTSIETPDVDKSSPIKGFKGYKRK